MTERYDAWDWLRNRRDELESYAKGSSYSGYNIGDVPVDLRLAFIGEPCKYMERTNKTH